MSVRDQHAISRFSPRRHALLATLASSGRYRRNNVTFDQSPARINERGASAAQAQRRLEPASTQGGQARKSLSWQEQNWLACASVRQVLCSRASWQRLSRVPPRRRCWIPEGWERFKKPSVSIYHLQLRRTILQTLQLEELTRNGGAVYYPGRWPAPWLCTSLDHRVSTVDTERNILLTGVRGMLAAPRRSIGSLSPKGVCAHPTTIEVSH